MKDDVINVGGGGDLEPELRLTRGDTDYAEVQEGEGLQSTCIIERADPGAFMVRWVSRDKNGEEKLLADSNDLYLSNVNADTLKDPIYCVAERIDDGEIFDKQMLIQLRIRTQPRTITVTPMPANDPATGQIVQKCQVEPAPHPSQPWEYVWLDPSGRIVSNNQILTVTISSEAGLGDYVCEAKNPRTSDTMRATFTIRALYHVTGTTQKANLQFYFLPLAHPDSQTYNTEVEPITPKLEFGRPFVARCFVNPTPPGPVIYTWYYNGRIVSQDERMQIPEFNRQTMGSYVCEAKSASNGPDRNGLVFSNATLSLRLKPNIEDHTEMRPPPGSTLITYIGEKRELHCEIPPNNRMVRWFFNGSEIDSYASVNRTGNLDRVDFRRVSILHLNGVEEFQEGNYECPDFEVEVNPPYYVVDEGEHVEIHCSVQGGKKIPNTDLRWFFIPAGTNRRIPLTFSGQGQFSRTDDPRAPSTSVIAKPYAMKSDEGDYVCVEPRGREGVSTLTVRTKKGVRLRISPPLITMRPGQDIIVSCFSTDMTGRATPPRPQLRVFDRRLTIEQTPTADYAMSGTVRGLDSTFNGTIIECFSDDPSVEPVRSVVYIQDVCPPGYRRCRSGDCLEAGRFCDGRYDCNDGSDEDPAFCAECDPIVKRCESFGGLEASKSTYMVHWECDGEDDCGNGYDEAACNGQSLASCSGKTFTCASSGQVIPAAFVCDKDPDCDRGEDEDGCSEPRVIDQPMAQYNYRRGERVVLTCEVAGKPSPRVIWRFNWGCLQDEGSRVTVRNEVIGCNSFDQRVRSTLTINNFRPGDDGIYNCEGLNGMKRAMSQDYLVVLMD
ncbi:unnamed protein product [Schistocephalus solidus]|uniref:Basement membrane-specific heparan sulfate proteoglycan core protein n=2 Tax=Schistocephalus solidus TaxID=70667 RepID=A0A183SNT7_SCHSO|nr:unnamed protein product [Schistocephalus solidus]